jgi:hypothetical protein
MKNNITEAIKSETIEHAACYCEWADSDSITVELRRWNGSYEVVYSTPERYHVFGEGKGLTLEQAEEIYDEHVELAKRLAAGRAMFD